MPDDIDRELGRIAAVLEALVRTQSENHAENRDRLTRIESDGRETRNGLANLRETQAVQEERLRAQDRRIAENAEDIEAAGARIKASEDALAKLVTQLGVAVKVISAASGAVGVAVGAFGKAIVAWIAGGARL